MPGQKYREGSWKLATWCDCVVLERKSLKLKAFQEWQVKCENGAEQERMPYHPTAIPIPLTIKGTEWHRGKEGDYVSDDCLIFCGGVAVHRPTTETDLCIMNL
jgi:hypothetical protein